MAIATYTQCHRKDFAMKNESIDNIMGSEIEMFWDLVAQYWCYEDPEEFSPDQAVKQAWEEQEVKGLLLGQEEKENRISIRQEILKSAKQARFKVSAYAEKAWPVLDDQDRQEGSKAIRSMDSAWKKMLQNLRDEILELDMACAANAQDHVLYKGSERETFLDALKDGFMDSLSLEKLICLIDYVDEAAPFLSLDERKEIKLGCYKRLINKAPEGEWESDYENLLKWWHNYQKEESQTVEIDAHGDVPFSSEDEIIAAIDANRRYNDLYKTLYIRFCREGIDAKRAKMEAFAVTCLQNMD